MMSSQLRLGGAVLFLASMALTGCLYFNRCGCEKSSSCCCNAGPGASTVVRHPAAADVEQTLNEGQKVTDK